MSADKNPKPFDFCDGLGSELVPNLAIAASKVASLSSGLVDRLIQLYGVVPYSIVSGLLGAGLSLISKRLSAFEVWAGLARWWADDPNLRRSAGLTAIAATVAGSELSSRIPELIQSVIK